MPDSKAGDPDSLTLGTPHGEEVAVVPWPILIRERIHRRARSSDRYRWLVLAVVSGRACSRATSCSPSLSSPSRVSPPDSTRVSPRSPGSSPLRCSPSPSPCPSPESSATVGVTVASYLIGMVGNVAVAIFSALAPDAGTLIVAQSPRRTGRCRARRFVDGARAQPLRLRRPGEGDGLVVDGRCRWSCARGRHWWGDHREHRLAGDVRPRDGPRGAIALVLAPMVLPEHGAGQRRHRGEGGASARHLWSRLRCPLRGSLLFGLNRAPVVGFSSWLVIGAFLASAVAGVALVLVERVVDDPLVPFRYLRRRNFALPLAAQTFGNFAYMGGFFLTPLLLEQVYRYGESASGLLVIARPITFAIVAPASGYVAVRVGERSTAIFGTCAVVASMAAFVLTSSHGGITLVEIALVLSGLGMGVASPSIAASIANVVDQDALGTASATQQLVVQIATVAGFEFSDGPGLASTLRQGLALVFTPPSSSAGASLRSVSFAPWDSIDGDNRDDGDDRGGRSGSRRSGSRRSPSVTR